MSPAIYGQEKSPQGGASVKKRTSLGFGFLHIPHPKVFVFGSGFRVSLLPDFRNKSRSNETQTQLSA